MQKCCQGVKGTKNHLSFGGLAQYLLFQGAFNIKYMPENLNEIVLPIDQRVRHSVFGEGTVTDVDTDKGAHLIKFDSMDTPRMISFKVKLEMI